MWESFEDSPTLSNKNRLCLCTSSHPSARLVISHHSPLSLSLCTSLSLSRSFSLALTLALYFFISWPHVGRYAGRYLAINGCLYCVPKSFQDCGLIKVEYCTVQSRSLTKQPYVSGFCNRGCVESHWWIGGITITSNMNCHIQGIIVMAH